MVALHPVRSPVSKPPLTATVGPASSVIDPSAVAEVMIGASSAPVTLNVSTAGRLWPKVSLTVMLNCLGWRIADLEQIEVGIGGVGVKSAGIDDQRAIGTGNRHAHVGCVTVDAVTLSELPASPGLSPASEMTLPIATRLPASVKGVSLIDAVSGH